MSTTPSSSSLNINAALSMPLPESEERMAIRRSDWSRLRREAEEMVNPIPNASQWGFFTAGSAIALLVAWLPWQAAFDAMQPPQRMKWAWVTPALLIGTCAFVVLTAFCIWIDKKVRAHLRSQNRLFCDDMDAIESVHPPGGMDA